MELLSKGTNFTSFSLKIRMKMSKFFDLSTTKAQRLFFLYKLPKDKSLLLLYFIKAKKTDELLQYILQYVCECTKNKKGCLFLFYFIAKVILAGRKKKREE